ncbi:MAG: hypothetical protein ACOYOK_06300 [Pseudobdellovibrionaceae bacterium]
MAKCVNSLLISLLILKGSLGFAAADLVYFSKIERINRYLVQEFVSYKSVNNLKLRMAAIENKPSKKTAIQAWQVPTQGWQDVQFYANLNELRIENKSKLLAVIYFLEKKQLRVNGVDYSQKSDESYSGFIKRATAGLISKQSNRKKSAWLPWLPQKAWADDSNSYLSVVQLFLNAQGAIAEYDPSTLKEFLKNTSPTLPPTVQSLSAVKCDDAVVSGVLNLGSKKYSFSMDRSKVAPQTIQLGDASQKISIEPVTGAYVWGCSKGAVAQGETRRVCSKDSTTDMDAYQQCVQRESSNYISCSFGPNVVEDIVIKKCKGSVCQATLPEDLVPLPQSFGEDLEKLKNSIANLHLADGLLGIAFSLDGKAYLVNNQTQKPFEIVPTEIGSADNIKIKVDKLLGEFNQSHQSELNQLRAKFRALFSLKNCCAKESACYQELFSGQSLNAPLVLPAVVTPVTPPAPPVTR